MGGRKADSTSGEVKMAQPCLRPRPPFELLSWLSLCRLFPLSVLLFLLRLHLHFLHLRAFFRLYFSFFVWGWQLSSSL